MGHSQVFFCVPVRMDNWTDMAKDVFLPTFINHALGINDLFLKTLASIAALVWDAVTLPCRVLIGVPYRVYTEYSIEHSSSLLEQLIQPNGHFEEARKHGIVQLVAHVEETHVTETLGQRRPDITEEALKNLPFQARKTSYDVVCHVCLKALPWSQEENQVINTTELFMRSFPSGAWNGQGSGSSRSSYSYICLTITE